MANICPMCDSKDIETIIVVNTIEYKRKKISYNKETCVCKECDERFSTLDLGIDKYIAEEKAKIDSELELPIDEIIRIRKQLNWTQAKAQYYIGGGAKAFSKYERGERKMGVAGITLLKALDLGYLTEEMLDNINDGVPNEDNGRCPLVDECVTKIGLDSEVANIATDTGIVERLKVLSS